MTDARITTNAAVMDIMTAIAMAMAVTITTTVVAAINHAVTSEVFGRFKGMYIPP
jgi:hypothetical protein